jgi:tRNA threonylcarbamoyladenosine biosynthesis protein TsaE
MKSFRINKIEDLPTIAKVFLESFSKATTIAFYGSMGVGKTTFIKALCQELKVIDTVNSPTFAIINEYASALDIKIYHFDLYRLESEKELIDIGFEDYLYTDNWNFIEWPEIAESLFGERVMRVKITLQKDESRLIELL